MNDPKDTCYVCKENPVIREGIALCKECLDKEDYSDIPIGLGMSTHYDDQNEDENG
jgi:hypothetical protein